MAYRWNDGRRQMPQDATIRMLIVLLWDALGIAKATALYAVDWDTRAVQWHRGREKRVRNGDVLNPLWLPHTVPAIRNYLLSRGIDPFTKPASRPRKLFDPYEHKPLSTQRAQIIPSTPITGAPALGLRPSRSDGQARSCPSTWGSARDLEGGQPGRHRGGTRRRSS